MNESEKLPHEIDENVISSLIETTEESIMALERQMSSAPSASIPSIEAQIREKQIKLEELKNKRDSILN